MGMAIVVGLALGIWASKRGLASSIILGIVGVIQTIPSIALLAIFVPFMGIGKEPAIVALFLSHFCRSFAIRRRASKTSRLRFASPPQHLA